MNIIDSWLDRVAVNRGYAKARDGSGALLAAVFGDGSGNSNLSQLLRGESGVTERAAIRSSWVFSNVDTLGKLAAETNLDIKRQKAGGGYVSDPDHPFVNLFKRPNPFMSKSYLLRYTSMWLQLRGSAAWLLVPDKTGALAQIWPLPADRVTPVADARTYISGYLYTPDGIGQKEVPLPVESVCYFREPSLFNYRQGMSKLDALRYAIETDQHAAGWNLDTFVNDVALRTLISLPSDISRGLFAQVKQEILTQLVDERKRFIVARGGEIKAEAIGLSHKEMEFLAGREFTREEIDRVFGFPAGFWAKEATEANSRTAMNVVIDMSVWPQLTMIGEEITAQILPRYYEDETIVAEFADIRRGNVELKLKEDKQRYEGMTVNEVRLELGLGKHENDTYGNMPWPLRADTRLTAVFVPLSTIADGTMGIEEIGSKLRSEDAAQREQAPQEDRADDPKSPDEKDETEDDDRAEQDNQDDPEKSVAAAKDWDRYKSIVKRRMKRGESPDGYKFFSTAIAQEELEAVRFALAFVTDSQGAEKAFRMHDGGYKATGLARDLSDAIQANVGAYREGQQSADGLRNELQTIAGAAAVESAIAGYGSDGYPTEVDDEVADFLAATPAAALRMVDIADRASSGELNETAIASVAALWASRIDYLFHFALTHKPSDPMLTWVTSTVRSCGDCDSMSGQSKKASEWRGSFLVPQSPLLSCGGWRCGCSLIE